MEEAVPQPPDKLEADLRGPLPPEDHGIGYATGVRCRFCIGIAAGGPSAEGCLVFNTLFPSKNLLQNPDEVVGHGDKMRLLGLGLVGFAPGFGFPELVFKHIVKFLHIPPGLVEEGKQSRGDRELVGQKAVCFSANRVEIRDSPEHAAVGGAHEFVGEDPRVARVGGLEGNIALHGQRGVGFFQGEDVNAPAAFEPVPEFVINDGRIIDVKDFGARGLPHAEGFSGDPFQGADLVLFLFAKLWRAQGQRTDGVGAQIQRVHPTDGPFFLLDGGFVGARAVGVAVGGVESEAVEFGVDGKRVRVRETNIRPLQNRGGHLPDQLLAPAAAQGVEKTSDAEVGVSAHAQVLDPIPAGTDIGQGAEHAGVKVLKIRNSRAGSGMPSGTESLGERFEKTDVDGLGGFCHGTIIAEPSA